MGSPLMFIYGWLPLWMNNGFSCWWVWVDVVVLSILWYGSPLRWVWWERGDLLVWEWWVESVFKVFDIIPQPASSPCVRPMEIGDRGSKPWDTYPSDWVSGIRRGNLHGLGLVKLMGFRAWSPQQWCFHWDVWIGNSSLYCDVVWMIVHVPGWVKIVESLLSV